MVSSLFLVVSKGVVLNMIGAALFALFVVRDSGVVLSNVVSADDVACFVVDPAVVGLVEVSIFSWSAVLGLLPWISQ